MTIAVLLLYEVTFYFCQNNVNWNFKYALDIRSIWNGISIVRLHWILHIDIPIWYSIQNIIMIMGNMMLKWTNSLRSRFYNINATWKRPPFLNMFSTKNIVFPSLKKSHLHVHAIFAREISFFVTLYIRDLFWNLLQFLCQIFHNE